MTEFDLDSATSERCPQCNLEGKPPHECPLALESSDHGLCTCCAFCSRNKCATQAAELSPAT